MSEDIEWCPTTYYAKGGEFRCRRDLGHAGIHMGESGDDMDYGFYPKDSEEKTWEIVADVRADLLAAQRRLGRSPASERMARLEAVAEAARMVEQVFKDYRIMDDADKFFREDRDSIGCDGLKMLHEIRGRCRALDAQGQGEP